MFSLLSHPKQLDQEPTPFNPSSAEVLAALQGGERSPEMASFIKTLGQQGRDHRAWLEEQRPGTRGAGELATQTGG